MHLPFAQVLGSIMDGPIGVSWEVYFLVPFLFGGLAKVAEKGT